MQLGEQPLGAMSILILFSFPLRLSSGQRGCARLAWLSEGQLCVWETMELRGNVSAHSFRRGAFAAKRELWYLLSDLV